MTNLKKVQSKVTDERVLLSYEKGEEHRPLKVSIVKVDINKAKIGFIDTDLLYTIRRNTN